MVYKPVFPGGPKTPAYHYESVRRASLASFGRPVYDKTCGSCPPPGLNQPWRDVVDSYIPSTTYSNMSNSQPEPSVDVAPEGTNIQTDAPTQAIQGITSFEHDAGTAVAEPVDYSRSALYARDHVEGADTIVDFLKRPTILYQGNLTTSDSTIMWSADPYNILIDGVKAAKLLGIYGIKADLVVTLNVNATRFMTGRYILAWLPSGGVPITSSEFGYSTRIHAFNLQTFSQLPHVEIDIGTQTSVELRIPWTSIYPYFVLSAAKPVGVGGLLLRPYQPLAAGAGDSACPFTMWAAFENVELTGPTYTQSSIVGATELAAKDKPVSGTLMKISKASTILGEIPLLTPVARQVAWASKVLSRAASVMGWSKPLLMSTPIYTRYRTSGYINNVDGPSMAVNMGSTIDSSLMPSPPNNLSNLDEMSIDFIKQVPAYVTSVSWQSQLAGASLYTGQVWPGVGRSLTGLVTTNTPMGMLSKMFVYWRGGIVFRIKLVKNEFYSGRLMFSFTPNYHGTGTTPSLTNSEYVHRVIVDIRIENEVEFEIPYISPDVWQSTNTSIGHFMISVVDPLVAPDSVSPSIVLLIEAFGASDLEFAAPVNPQYDVIVPVTTQMGKRYHLGSPGPSGVAPSAVCIGEKIESLRQYWKIPQPLSSAATEAGTIVGTLSSVYYNPFLNPVANQITSISTGPSPSTFKGDVIGLISSFYLFTTGSMRVFSTTNVNPLMVGLTYQETVAPYWTSTINKDVTAFTKHFANGDGFDFEVPAWYPLMSRLVSSSWINNSVNGLSASPLAIKNTLSWNTPATTAVTMRQPSDNANCFQFLGVPPTVNNRLT